MVVIHTHTHTYIWEIIYVYFYNRFYTVVELCGRRFSSRTAGVGVCVLCDMLSLQVSKAKGIC